MLVASAVSASADYYGGMKEAPVSTFQPASWYVRGDFSHSWMDAGELRGAITPFNSWSIDNTWSLGGGIGYYFGRGFRGDLTYDWRANTDVRGRGGCSTDFDLRSSLLLANLYYDFRAYERFTPYVGLGLGAVHHQASGGNIIDTGCGTPVITFDSGSNWSAAGAVMAGFSFRIDRGGHERISIKDQPVAAEPGRLHLDVGYRFLYLGDAHAGNISTPVPPVVTPGPHLDDITAHEIRVGLRWDIR